MWVTSKTRNSMEFSNMLKIGAVVGVLFMSILNSHILVTTPGPTSYEVSIYSAFPRILWVNFIFIDVLVLFWILFDPKNSHRAIMIGILFLNQLTILLLPLFRGYLIYGRFDVLEHLGRVKDILLTGNIGSDNFYPIMHILIAEIRTVANISLNSQTSWLPAFFWAMLLMWYFMFISNFTRDTNLGKFSTLLWVFFPLGYWHTSMVGNMFSYYFMFLILGVWFSSVTRQKKCLLIAVLYSALVFFHPLTSMYLLMVFVTFDLLDYVFKAKKEEEYFTKGLGIVMVVIWTIWYLSFEKTKYPLRAFWFSLVGLVERKNSFFSMYVSNVERYHLPILRVVKFSLYRYWGIILVGGLALIVIVKFLGSIRTKRKNELVRQNIVIFALFIVLFSIWSVLNVFLKFVNFERSLRYVVAFSIPLASTMVFRLKKLEINRKRTLSIMILFLLFSYFGTFTVHSSPLTGKPNNQVSASEYYGMGWWFKERDDSLRGYDDGQITQYRFYETWYGRDSAFKAKNLLHYRRGRSLIPEHFGYDKNEFAGNAFESPVYFILGKAVFEFYNATIWDRVNYWRWKPNEVLRLRCDITVNAIYSSPDINIYLITQRTL